MSHAQHDPLRQAAYLKQCLSEHKRPIGFLLAAGCPQAVKMPGGKPLIPAIDQLTENLNAAMAKEVCAKSYQKLLANLATDGNPKPNLEVILTHLRGLFEVAGNDKARGLTADELKKLDATVCAEIVASVGASLPSILTPYHRFATWVGARERKFPIEVFTPNYDLLFEQSFEDHGVPYFDGFIGSYRAFFDTQAMDGDRLPSRWARLWKLHGSINWRQTDAGKVYRGSDATDAACHMIHPSHLKYEESRRMPYLAMMDRLRHFLRQPSAVLVCAGYSFGDKHINSVLQEGMQGNSHAAVFALCYGGLSGYSLGQKLAEGLGNFSLFAQDQAIIGTRQESWRTVEKSSTVAVQSVGDKDSAQFQLGDFVVFGDFLVELMGETQQLLPSDAD